MYNDILNGKIDYDKEMETVRELLKEAKDEIIKERARRFILEDLNNENFTFAKECAKTIKQYRDDGGKKDFDNLDETFTDKWDDEDLEVT